MKLNTIILLIALYAIYKHIENLYKLAVMIKNTDWAKCFNILSAKIFGFVVTQLIISLDLYWHFNVYMFIPRSFPLLTKHSQRQLLRMIHDATRKTPILESWRYDLVTS